MHDYGTNNEEVLRELTAKFQVVFIVITCDSGSPCNAMLTDYSSVEP